MNSLRHYPLGEPIPNSPHAVVSSLPTMADLRAYEEKEARVVDAMRSGYPRFVTHAYIKELVALYQERAELSGRVGVLIPSRTAVEDLRTYLGGGLEAVEVEDGLFLVHVNAADTDLEFRMRKLVQHIGCGISSREAEDGLLRHGRLERRHSEPRFEGDAFGEVEGRFATLCGCSSADVRVCASGMNAFYTAFRSVRAIQSERGRRHWLQIGWVYVDSGCILEKLLGDDHTLERCFDVTQTEALVRKIEALGEKLAGVVIECPTNPLLQMGDLPALSAAVRQAGGMLIADPSMVSVYNVDVLPYADVLVASLTKYTAHEADVLLGAFAVNPEAPAHADLLREASACYAAPYNGDVQRLAHEMQSAPEVVAKMNHNAGRLATYLESHPAVGKVVYAAKSPHYRRIARSDGSGGSVVTFVLNGSMEAFFDTISAAKGPSFGTGFTLLAPFMYLAHYDLVTTEAGRCLLKEAGIPPELIRVSVGAEPYEAIEAVFAEALKGY